MRRREHSANELHRGHRQLDPDAELLLHLGGVPVADRLERAHHAGALRMVRILSRLTTPLARPDLALDDDRARRIDEAGTRERQEREDRRRRIAAGSGDELRRADLVAVQLGDPVHGGAEQLGVGMVDLVPGSVDRCIAQPVVGRQIDDQRSARPELREPVRAVRQRQEQDVAPGHVLVADELERRAFPEVRVRGRDRLPGERLAARDDLPHLGMPAEQPQQLATGVATGADDADLHQVRFATPSA